MPEYLREPTLTIKKAIEQGLIPDYRPSGADRFSFFA